MVQLLQQHANATTAVAGLMSTADKTKLDGVATGAEVNQNAFSNVKVGTTTAAANAKTDTLEIAGSGSVTVSASGKKITVSGTNTTYANYAGASASADGTAGLVPPASIANRNKFLRGDATWQVPTDTTYAAATTETDGLMSSADKTKLDGVATGAEVNQNAFSSVKVGTTTANASAKTDTLTVKATGAATVSLSGKELSIGATNTTYAVTNTTAAGLAPKLSGGTTCYLRGDGTWVVPPDTTYATVTTSANGLMSSTDKAKLDDVASSAEVNQNAFSNVKVGSTTASADDKTDTLTVKATGAASVSLNGKELTIGATNTTYGAATGSALGLVKTGSNITNSSGTISLTKANVTTALGYAPPDTNTTYAEATTNTAGLMSASDKTKLDGVATGAEVNQNAFGKVVAGTTTAAASDKVDSLTLKATGAASVSISGKEVTIGSTDTTYANYVGATSAAAGTPGLVPSATAANRNKFLRGDATWQVPTNTTYAAVTTAANGLMTKEDKIKLNGITAGATSYAAATQSADGLMSSADKTKLDGVETGANKTVVDTAMSTTSTNPVQNKVVDAAIKAVETRVTTILDGADTAFDTFKEISDWIDTHETEFEALQDLSANKVDKVEGKGLSTNDYTTAEKNKLAGIAASAEVNQNAFSNVKVGSTTAAANAKTDTLEIAGSGSVTVSASGKKITVSGTNTTYAAATTAANGLMSSADKTKLDGITEGATTYAFTNGAKTLAWDTTSTIATVGGVDITVKMPANPDTNTTYAVTTTAAAGLAPKLSGGTTSYLRGDGTWQTPTNTTYAAVTTAANGLMTKEDKIKLNGVATGAEVNQNAFSNVVVGTTTAAAGAKTDSLTVKATGAASVSLSGKELTINSTDTTYAAATGSALGLVKTGSNITNSSGTISLTKANVTAALGYTPPSTDTNTTYAVATSEANGLMSKDDKAKLDGVATGAEVNQNAFSSVVVGTTTAAATSATDSFTVKATGAATVSLNGKELTINSTNTTYGAATNSALGLVKTGNNITNSSGTISLSKANVTAALGYTPPSTDTNTTYAVATSEANGLMSSTDKAKLDGIAENANNYVHPTATAKNSGLYKVAVDGTGHVTAATAVAKADITGLGIPAQDTTYAAATTSANGLMSKDDKIKLNGVATGAEVNQNAFSNVVVGTTTAAAGAKTDTLTVKASGAASVSLSGKELTINSTDTTYANYVGATASAAGTAGLVPSATAANRNKFLRGDATWQTPTNTTYAAVTTAANGLMTAADKIKLNGIAENANNYTHPTATSKASGLYKVAVDGTGHVTAATAVAKADITGLGIPAQDTTYAAATTAANGLMTKDDKIKLNGIAANANNYTHPTATSQASGLYKVAVDGTGHVTAATAVAKADITALGIPGTDTNTTYANYVGATASAAGTAGLVPAAATADRTKFLRGDATWQVPTNTTYAAVTTAANGLMTKEDKIKLNGIAEGANNYTHPTATSKASGLYKVTVDGTGHVTAATAVAKADITGLGIPAQDTTYAAATGSALGLVKVGSNISNSSGTISLSKANVTAALGYTPPSTDTNTTYDAATTAVAGLMSAADKIKLDGVAENANNYVHPTATAKSSGLYKVAVDGTGHVTAATAVAKADITALGIPGTDTNTTYAAVTTAANGLMTKEDKIKLNGVAENANNYVHPTATSKASGLYKVTVDGTGHVTAATAVAKADITGLGIPAQDTTYAAATGSALGLVKTGSNITNSSGTISLTKANVTAALGYEPPTTDTNTTYANYVGATTAASGTAGLVPAATTADRTKFLRGDATWQVPTNTTYGAVTTAANGLMTAADKKKLDAVASSANNYVHPTATSKASGLYKVTVDGTGHVTAATAVAKTDITGLGIPAQDTTYAAVTTAANGLMSKDDKIKLNGIAEGANNYVHPTATAKDSGLYKVAVDGTGHVTAATAVAKADITGLGIPAQDTTYAAATGSALGLVKVGSNISNSSGTISLSKANVTAALGYTPPSTNTTYANYVGATTAASGTAGLVPAATTATRLNFLRGDGTWQTPTNTTYAAVTTAANGLMTKEDKIKLNGVAENANNYVHPTATSKASGLYKVTVDGTGHVTAATAVAKADITGLGIPAQDTTYAAATGSALGLVKTGSNITNSSGTISLTKANVTAALGYEPPTTDTNTTYASLKNPNALTIGNKSYDGSEAIDGGIGVYYKTGTGTAAVTTSPYTFAKWDCTDERVTELYDGLMMLYKVPVAGNGTYGTCFQVNSLGYHPVVSVVNTMVGTRYGVNSTILLVYDSTVSANVYNNSASAAAISGVWCVVNDYDSGNTNTVPAVQCETAAATAAKAGTCTNYTLTANTYVFINFRYANSSKTAITLNINSKGAKPIYINGAASSTSNYTLPAGTYIAYYNGTNFYFRTDGLLPGNYGGTAMKLDTATTLGKGLVPTLTGSTSVYLNGNGAWTTPTNTTYGAATTAALGLVKIGSNITNSSGTISLAKANVTAALGYTPPTTNTTYAAVTTAANGLMTAADKIKLNTLLDLVTTDKSAGSTDLIYGLILETE